MSIEVKGVVKRFGAYTALDEVSLQIPAGALMALLGPSGSGKTTLLRIIAGLEHPDQGAIFFHEEEATTQPARERNVGFVFQHYTLFRHMTLFDNIAFGLKVRKRPKEEIQDRVHELLRLIQLEGMEARYPAQLSGGQRQRVALARALATRPRILLLDEPFGALDTRVRQELRQWIRRLHDETGATSLFVTHDQDEALELADQVVVMERGRIEQVGTPEEIYHQPATPFVVNFLGSVNRLRGYVEGDRLHLEGGLEAAAPPHLAGARRPVTAYARTHELAIQRADGEAAPGMAKVNRLRSSGATVRVDLSLTATGQSLEAVLSRQEQESLGLAAGDVVHLTPRAVRVFADP